MTTSSLKARRGNPSIRMHSLSYLLRSPPPISRSGSSFILERSRASTASSSRLDSNREIGKSLSVAIPFLSLRSLTVARPVFCPTSIFHEQLVLLATARVVARAKHRLTSGMDGNDRLTKGTRCEHGEDVFRPTRSLGETASEKGLSSISEVVGPCDHARLGNVPDDGVCYRCHAHCNRLAERRHA